jgi:predicted adenine nucleotide alpha hydrolase (AANH) superfamily ATPase
METEAITLLEQHLKTRIVFKAPRITGNQEYRQRVLESMRYIFDDKQVIAKANLDFIHKGWTFGFLEDKNLN